MSNHLAIATVTASLQRLLQNVIQRDVEGARVTTLKPNNIGNGTPEAGVNVFLYQVEHNTALRNGDTAVFRSKKGPIRRQSSLDLFYMLSTYGNEVELEPQRLLGSVVRTLSDKTVLSREMIDGAIADVTFLSDSDLAGQEQQLTINPVKLDADELSKIWSTFFQAPYSLSLAYKVMAVVIDGEVSAHRALPVRERRVGQVMPFPHRPILEKISAHGGIHVPIRVDTTLRLTGQQLQGQQTRIKIQEFELSPQAANETEITIALSGIPHRQIRAGIQTVQVLHYPSQSSRQDSGQRLGQDSSQQSGQRLEQQSNTANIVPVVSNALPFVLSPTITSVIVASVEGLDDDPRCGILHITTDVRVGQRQKAMITLNEWSVTDPATYLFAASSRSSEGDRLEIAFDQVKPGDYLVRLQIDGADSLLEVDTDPTSPTFNWFNGPRVVIQ